MMTIGDVESREEGGNSELRFEPYLVASHPAIVALSDELAAAYFKQRGSEKRRPSKEHVANIEEVARTVTANLARSAVAGVRLWLSRKALHQAITRYDREGFSAGLAKLLDALDGGVFAVTASAKRGRASIITVAPKLAKKLREIPPWTFERRPQRETIHLARVEHVDGRKVRTLVDYRKATKDAGRYRKEMAEINAALRSATMRFEDDRRGPVFASMRDLHRSFVIRPGQTAHFDQGGRLFGGWWLNLEKTRRASIRLDDEPIADLDFEQMFLRLAYCAASLEPPPGDLYHTITSRLHVAAHYRKGFKEATSALLSAPSPLRSLPPDVRPRLPPGMSITDVRNAIASAHSPVAHLFEQDLGLRLMFTDSQILVAALLKLIREHHVTALLPMHDGIMVPRSKQHFAREALQEAAEEITGCRLPVSLKETVG